MGERLWLVTFMHYDLGYFDDETSRLEPIENPFGAAVLPCARNKTSPIRPEQTLRKLARRTGRFPQLVDPRSSVNGLLLTGSPRFREVSLEIDAAFAGSSTLRR